MICMPCWPKTAAWSREYWHIITATSIEIVLEQLTCSLSIHAELNSVDPEKISRARMPTDHASIASEI